jgi:hypothetical protein
MGQIMARRDQLLSNLQALLEQHPSWLETVPLTLKARLGKHRSNGKAGLTRELRRDKNPEATFSRLLNEFSQIEGLEGEVKVEVMTNQAAQAVDRASRGSNWASDEENAPLFTDYRGHLIRYHESGMDLIALRDQLNRMNPRTADVWRLITAKVLSQWREDESEPDAVWVDVRDFVTEMGYRRKTKGEYNPEALELAAEAITDLNRLYLTITTGTTELPIDPKTGRRKPTQVEVQRERKVLNVEERDVVRVLGSGETYPLRWKVRLGPWIKNYPKQFVPMQKKLVELPAKGSDAWAKTVGMELLFLLREGAKHEDAVRRIKVQTLLERAGLWDDAMRFQENRNGRRIQDYLERALDTLVENSILKNWEYDPHSESRIDKSRAFPGLAVFATLVLLVEFDPLALGRPKVPIPN